MKRQSFSSQFFPSSSVFSVPSAVKSVLQGVRREEADWRVTLGVAAGVAIYVGFSVRPGRSVGHALATFNWAVALIAIAGFAQLRRALCALALLP